MQRYDIFISLVKKLSLKSFLQFLWAGENPLKNHNNLMHYFDIILLNDVIEHLDQKSHVRSHIVIISVK